MGAWCWLLMLDHTRAPNCVRPLSCRRWPAPVDGRDLVAWRADGPGDQRGDRLPWLDPLLAGLVGVNILVFRLEADADLFRRG